MPISEVFNQDCMEGMKSFPDKYFDIACVDPPYGLEWGGTGFKKKNIQERNLSAVKEWESKPPTKEYFNELFRVSKNQIIWGGNYFGDFLGKCKAPIIWDKQTGGNSFADGEYAWTSFETGTLRIFRHQWCGAFKDSERGIKAFHPTQKPIALYKWLLDKFAYCKTCHNEGGFYEDVVGDGGSKMYIDCENCDCYEFGAPKILDTHLGSGSSRIAAYDMGFDFYGYEIDKGYFAAQEQRFGLFKSQQKLF